MTLFSVFFFFTIMPSHRKRIGFLPSEEVHEIIEKICSNNNYSQSKVTGILVEEALKVRNLYKSKNKEGNREILLNELNESKKLNKIENFTFENKYIEEDEEDEEDEEYKLIKEYLNYKNFKKILSIVQSKS